MRSERWSATGGVGSIRRRYRSVWVGGLLVLVAVGVLAYLTREQIAWQLKPWDERPSCVLIVLDDLDWDLVAEDWLGRDAAVVGERETPSESDDAAAPGASRGSSTPRFPVLRELAGRGLVFTNFHSTTPVCGPARACLLSGQYASRHGVRVNRPDHPTSNGFSGGVQRYGRELDWAQFWQQAGYETGFVGKYVHDGFNPDPQTGNTWSDLLPRGWDHFHASLGASYSDFYVVDSRQLQTLPVKQQFRTTYEADRVLEQLAARQKSKQAQLICWFPLAPHDSTDATLPYPTEFSSAFATAEPPSWSRRPGAAGLDLPQTLRQVLPSELSAEQRAGTARSWRERLRSIAAFDRELGRIRDKLRAEGRLDKTVFVITSDHGYRLGDHGHVGKRLPYDRITRVPLLISGAGVRMGVCNDLLGNVDLAPTLLELAGGLPFAEENRFDGRSFARAVVNEEGTYAPNRQELLLQSWEAEAVWGQRVPSVWTMLRTPTEVYTEWANGEREYYDLRQDPEQCDNRYDELTATEARAWQERLRGQAAVLNTPPLLQVPEDVWQRLVKFPQNPTFQPILLPGFAEANAGIEAVDMSLREKQSGRYWSGNAWSDEEVWLPVGYDNPGGVLSRWSMAWQVEPGLWPEPEVVLETGERRAATAAERRKWSLEVEVAVRTMDRTGGTDTWESPATLVVRPFDPETWLDVPLADKWTGVGPVTLTGRAVGMAPIKQVRLVVQDKLTKQYWNGQDWGEEQVQNEAEVVQQDDGTARWSYRFEGSGGSRLYFAARALDEKNYFDHSVASFELPEIGTVPPVGELDGEAGVAPAGLE